MKDSIDHMPLTPEFAYRLAVVRGLNSHGGLYSLITVPAA